MIKCYYYQYIIFSVDHLNLVYHPNAINCSLTVAGSRGEQRERKREQLSDRQQDEEGEQLSDRQQDEEGEQVSDRQQDEEGEQLPDRQHEQGQERKEQNSDPALGCHGPGVVIIRYNQI